MEYRTWFGDEKKTSQTTKPERAIVADDASEKIYNDNGEKLGEKL